MKSIRKADIYLEDKRENRTVEVMLKVGLALIPLVIIVASIFFFDVKPMFYEKKSFQADIGGMVQPESLHQTFRYIELPNRMKGMVISDPKELKASAAVRIDAGAGEDPANFAGVAHLLEHVLHLGTKRYPSDQDYKFTLSKNGGSSNAFTSDECTTYFFSVNNGALEKVLDIFSSFFEAPLFDKTTIEKEANAVHSEHEKNLVSDGRRFYQLIRDLSHAKHKFNRFTTGSLETLVHVDNGEDLTSAIKKFYRKHYVASKMTFSIVGNYSLDDLQKMAEKYFANVNTLEKSFDGEIADTKKSESKKGRVTLFGAFGFAFSEEPISNKTKELAAKIPNDKSLNIFSPGRFKEEKSLFVDSKKSVLKSGDSQPFLENAFKKYVVYESIGSLKSVSVVTPFTGSKTEMETYEDYFNFIDKFLTNSDKKSLFGKLKMSGLVQGINTFYDRSSENSRIYIVRFSLTESGMGKWHQILNAFYSYIERMYQDANNLPIEEQTLIDYLNFLFGYQSSSVGTALHFVKRASADPTNFMREHVQLDYSQAKFRKILSQIAPETSLMIIGKPSDQFRFSEKKTGLDQNIVSVQESLKEKDIENPDDRHKRTIDVVLEIAGKNKDSCEKCQVQFEDNVDLPEEKENGVSYSDDFESVSSKSTEGVSKTKKKRNTNSTSNSEKENKTESSQTSNSNLQKSVEVDTKRTESQVSNSKTLEISSEPKSDKKDENLSLKKEKDFFANAQIMTNSLYKFNYKVSAVEESDVSTLKNFEFLNEQEIHFPDSNRFIPEDISIKFSHCVADEVNNQNKTFTFLGERKEFSSLIFSPFFSNILKKVHSNENTKVDDECKEKQLKEDKQNERSELAYNNSGLAILYKSARHLKIPKVQVRIKLFNNDLLDPSLYTFAKLDSAVLIDLINEKLPDAKLFSTIKISTSNEGYEIKIETFSSVIMRLLKNVLEIMDQKELPEMKTIFENVKNRFVQGLTDFKVKQPLSKATSYLENILYKDSPLPKEVLQRVKSIDYENFKEKMPVVRQGSNYRVVFFGNIIKEDIDEATNLVKEYLKVSSNFNYNMKPMPISKIPDDSSLVIRFENENPSDVNNGVLNYYQFGKLSDKERVMMNFLVGPLRSIAFNHIRTHKQMGYIVSVSTETESRIYGVKIMAQGSFANCHAMEREVEESLKQFHQFIVDELEQTTINDFLKLMKERRNLEEFEYQSDLEWMRFEDDFIEKIPSFTKDDLHDFFEKVFIRSPKKISVQVYSQKKRESLQDTLKAVENVSGRNSTLVTDSSYFKTFGYYE